MDTSAIAYRVVDFLNKHPPFQAIEEEALLALVAQGRVRFHEANEYLLWQGEPHRLHMFVIQQGTVSLWDESEDPSALRDVRGAGDMLGIERYNGAPNCLYSARSASDVVIYAFPAADFEEVVLKDPYARQFVEAYDRVTPDYQRAKDKRDPQNIFLHDLVRRKTLVSCAASASIRDVARSMLATGRDAIAVVDRGHRIEAVATVDAVLAWVAGGAGNAEQPIGGLIGHAPPTVGSAASVVDGVLAIGDAEALALTSDGSAGSRLQALVTAKDFARAFGDQPISILREIRLAATIQELSGLNHRARALVLHHLTSATSLDWLTGFVSQVDDGIFKRVIGLSGGDASSVCWCFSGAAGRGESLTRHAPQLVLIVEDQRARVEQLRRYEHVSDALAGCAYLPRNDTAFDRSFHVASVAEWKRRYESWLDDPVLNRMYLARPLFDLRPVHGDERLWQQIEATVGGAVDLDLLQVVANDCLASLPPLTFYEDAVVDESGEQTSVFRLEHSALQPLVDVGRVFGMAAHKVLGTSTRQRFDSAPRADSGARVDLPRSSRDPADPAVATGAHRHRARDQRVRIAAGPAQPAGPACVEERLPLDPSAPRVHRQLSLVRGAVSEPAVVDAYRACFETTWTDETPTGQVRFVVFDSETTGLDPRTDRIVTMGAIAVCDDEILLGDTFAALLKLDENTTAVTVHGVTRDETRGGLGEKEALSRLLAYLQDAVVVGHHVGHDIAALDAACEREWGARIMNRHLDTMDLALHLERDGAFAGRPPFRSFTLDALCDRFDVIPHGRHTAGGDAFLTAQVFLRLLRLAARHGRTTLLGLSEPFTAGPS